MIVTIVFFAVFVAVLLGVLFSTPGSALSSGLMTLAVILVLAYVVMVFYSATQNGAVFRSAREVLTGRAARPKPNTRGRGAPTASSNYAYIPVGEPSTGDGAGGATETLTAGSMESRKPTASAEPYDELYDPHAAARRLDSEMVNRYDKRGRVEARSAHENFARTLNEGRMRPDEYLVPVEDSSADLFPR